MIGQKLSHYRVVEQIGAGGMGVVYRAHDEQLDRDVAIKILPPKSLADETASKRFRKEALSLARLNHPNVATVHEFGTQDGTDFLVTEYIAGTNLDIQILNKAMAPKEVVRLGLQLAEGLAAAHEQGIVHRDLKPGNLRITKDGRLKILDFGLAQFSPQASELGLTQTMTTSQEVSGTLPYMAPEQLGGEVTDARADIWSAGAVLYEMATGRRPFVHAAPAMLINAILNQAPEAPSKINSAVPPMLDAIIMKALAKDPAQRYQTARDLADDLQLSFSPTSAVVAVHPRKKWGGLVSVFAAVLLVGVVGGYFFAHRTRHIAVPAVNARRSVAVLGFKNLSGNAEKSWLSTAISEMLTTELSEGDQLRTIPGESVAQMKINLSLPDADSFSQPTLNRIRQNLGSDNVVFGSYLPLGNGQLRLDLRLQDAVGGDTLASVSEKGSEAEIDTLVSRAGAALRAKLGVGSLSNEQNALVRASLPANAEAARLYSEGLQKMRVFDALAARDLLEKAAALDPGHAPTHSALAEALTTLGYDEKAKEQAKKALDLSARFSREEKLLIEARAHERLGEPEKAIESYRALWTFFPDRVDYGVFLIRAQTAGGHGADAEATLAEVRKLPLSDADTARLDIAEANLANTQSDYKREAASATRAAEKGRSIGANLVVAQALGLEGEALERMGQSDKTVELSAQARELYNSAGDRRGAARSLLLVGDLLFDQGKLEEAKKEFEAALPVFRELGAQKSVRSTLERIGNVYYQQGKLAEAEKYYNQTLAFDRTLHDPIGLASDYGNLANALDGLGDLPGTLKMQQQALAAFNENGDRRGSSATLNNLGNLFVEMGKLGEARKYFEQSLDLTRKISYRRGEPYPTSGIGDTLLLQGDLAGARKQYDAAMVLCKEMDDLDFGAQLHTSMAIIALHEEKFSDGVGLAQQAIEQFEKSNSAANVAWSSGIMARNLMGEGKLDEARTVAAKALTLAKQTAGLTSRYEAVLADARVKAKSGKTAEARQELEASLASAHKLGYGVYEFQIRLALAEIELGSGAASARAHLTSLETDARGHGVGLVADAARELLQKK